MRVIKQLLIMVLGFVLLVISSFFRLLEKISYKIHDWAYNQMCFLETLNK